MESSAKRRLPGIKQLAQRFNALQKSVAEEARRKRLRVPVPQPVDITQLFNTDANPAMWMENGQIEELPSPPPYLTDPSVQQGIGAVLAQDRGEEESHRLKHELASLINWITSNLNKTDAAMSSCKGNHIFFCAR